MHSCTILSQNYSTIPHCLLSSPPIFLRSSGMQGLCHLRTFELFFLYGTISFCSPLYRSQWKCHLLKENFLIILIKIGLPKIFFNLSLTCIPLSVLSIIWKYSYLFIYLSVWLKLLTITLLNITAVSGT